MPRRTRRELFLATLLFTALPALAAGPMDLRLRCEDGQAVRLGAFAGHEQPCVLIFVASTCPASSLIWDRLKGTWYNHRDSGLRMALVGGNSDDTPEALRALLKEAPSGLDLPILWDTGHELATALDVNSTPVAVVLSPAGTVLYRGPIDDQWRNGARVQHPWLEEAVRAALQGGKIEMHAPPPFSGSRMR